MIRVHYLIQYYLVGKENANPALDLTRLFERTILPSTDNGIPDWGRIYVGDNPMIQPYTVGDPISPIWEVKDSDLPKFTTVGQKLRSDESITGLSFAAANLAKYSPETSYFIHNDAIDSVATLLRSSDKSAG